MTVVRTQTELDAALAAGDPLIEIRSDPDVTLTITSSGSSRVWAYGSSRVEAYDSSRVEAYDSSSVWAYDSSSVEAYGSSSVWAYGSSRVEAGRFVAVHVHSSRATCQGGVQIDLTDVDLTDAATWLDWCGLTAERGKVTLYKAVDDDLAAGHSYTRTVYPIGGTVVAGDWRDDHKCGGGLHVSPTVTQAAAHFSRATRFLAVEVAVRDVRPIDGGKCKVPRLRVVCEVDRWGDEVTS